MDETRIARLRAELKAATAAVDAEYWRFCRMARAKPPSAELCRAREAARERLADALTGRRYISPSEGE